MNLVDLIVLVILGLSGLVGLFRGAVREVFGLAALLLGFVLAVNYYAEAGEALAPWITDRLVAQGAAFFGILLVAWAIFALAGLILRRVLKLLSLSWLDRLGGLAFGLARGALVVSVLSWSFTAFGIPAGGVAAEALMESRLSRKILVSGDRIAGLFPEEFASRLKAGVRRARKGLDDAGAPDSGA